MPGAPAALAQPIGAGSTSATRPSAQTLSTTDLSRRANNAISKGVRYLLSKQSDGGGWVGRPTEGWGGGPTALVTLALLSCGEDPQSPPMVQAVKLLKRVGEQESSKATYSVGLHASVFAVLPGAARGPELRGDLTWLETNMLPGQRSGLYNYGSQGQGDYSNSQYGVLGVWAAAEAGLEVPLSYWRTVENAWLRGQHADGGWGYTPRDSISYVSMTAAALATLYITHDYLHARDYQNLARPFVNKPLAAGLEWMAENFAVDSNPGYYGMGRGINEGGDPNDPWVHYMLFGYERVGEATGLTRFGEHKWYDEGAEFLIRTQAYDGSWNGKAGPEVSTAYALLFLSRGRSPVVAQKLEAGERWNNRPRDVAGFTRFMRRATERHVNWQIVPITATPAEFRDSPLLYIASDRPLALDDAGKTAIRTYIEQGGLVVAANEGSTSSLTQNIISLARELFPLYSFRDLPKDHQIYTANFSVSLPTAPIRGLSNGLRELIILYPVGDMPWQWHSAGGGFAPRNTPYASLANLWLYATDRANPRYKGEDVWVERDPSIQTTRSLTLARLRYGGNWNPEPAGWTRLSNIMANFDQFDLKVQEVDTVMPPEVGLAHLTATRAIQPTNDRRAMIRNYLSNGGLLLMDAAGGAPEVPASYEQLLKDLFPDVVIAPLPLTHPIYHASDVGGFELDSVDYRRIPNAPAIHIPRLRGATVNSKLVAIISYQDISGALVGYAHSGLNGYTPASAADLMRNLILWRASSLRK
jgi:hypothetical protein